MAFSLDDLIAKATEVLDKASEDHLKKSEQFDGLIELINDGELRDQLDALVEQGSFLGLTLLGRLQDIFAEEDEVEPEPTPAPEPEPTLDDIFGEDFTERLNRILGGLKLDEDPRGPGFPF